MNPEITKIIEQYLNNELSESDKTSFEERLNENEVLRKEVELQKSVHEGAKRAGQRTLVQKTAKSYHFKKNFITSAVIVVTAAVIAIGTYIAVKKSGNTEQGIGAEQLVGLIEQLDKIVPMDNIAAEYFNLSPKDTVVLSENGVLLSVPNGAFLMNGKPYTGRKIIQWQEALDAATIVKGGLSTMSGDKLLETQGMFGIQAFTPDGKKLEVNPKIGVYVQVPVNELKEGMQLFEGKPKANGVIDWQNPKPLEKKPVLAAMKDLDFYPEGYEKELNNQKWKTGKKSRDSLYLSLEQDNASVIIIEGTDYSIKEYDNRKFISDSVPPFLNGRLLFQQKCATCHKAHKDGTGPKLFQVRQKWVDGGAKDGSIYKWVNNWNIAVSNDPYALQIAKIKPTNMNDFPELSKREIDAIFDHIDGIPFGADDFDHIPPVAVLAFWNPEFNNTILSTRDFERRMAVIHSTCNEEVLKQYTGNLDKPIYEIDQQVAKMGYPQFEEFAKERVGKIALNDQHTKNLQAFYDRTIAELKEKAKNDKDFVKKLEAEYESKINKSRSDQTSRKANRESQNYSEEYELNYVDCLRQLGTEREPLVGFIITGGASVYNLDRFVADRTTSRTSGSFYDKKTGKTAKIQYNEFSVSVENPEQYDKLFLYLFPKEMNSFQRIDPKMKGIFDYPLNNIMSYDLALVGLNENGFFIHTQTNVKSGALGTLKLKKLSEKEFNSQIEKLNSGRVTSPMSVKEELSWLSEEKKDYKVQRLRKEMQVFRNTLRNIVFPCGLSDFSEAAEVPEM